MRISKRRKIPLSISAVSTFVFFLLLGVASSCSLLAQRDVLRSFYHSSGGSSWTVSSPGWSFSSETDPCKWQGVECSDKGLVASLYLPFNNVSSISLSLCDQRLICTPPQLIGPNLGGIVSPELGCSLTAIHFQGNALSGTIPVDLSSVLSKLKSLNLASNSLTGSIPPELFEPSNASSSIELEYLDLSWNSLNGTLPAICTGAEGSSLINVFLSHNQLSGSLNLTGCNMIDLIDISMNEMIEGSVETSSDHSANRHLSVAFLLGTNISNINGLISSSPHISSLDASNTPLMMIPDGIQDLASLITLRMSNTNMYGTLPDALFSNNNLKRLEIANNWLSGTIPSIENAKSLSYVDLSFQMLSGTIPESFVDVLGYKAMFLDLRLNFLSCCGLPPLINEDMSLNVSYSGYNLSLPRLPPGLKQSSKLKPVVYSTLFTGLFTSLMNNLGNSSYAGLQCPYLLLENDTDSPENYLDWNLDPEYYLFQGCFCFEGRRQIQVPFHGFLVTQCVDPLPNAQQWYQQSPWIVFLIVFIGTACLCILCWSVYSAISSARKQRDLLKATQEAKAKLEEEHVKTQALLARQLDLLRCFEDGISKSGDGVKIKKKSRGVLTSDAIEAAKRQMGTTDGEAIDNQIELHQVIGEGSYGKVYRGLWRGTLVAIKMMVLPAHMSGQEKREKMAVMEAAISSTLSHPNIVTTYTYSIKPCEDMGLKLVIENQAIVMQEIGTLGTSAASQPVSSRPAASQPASSQPDSTSQTPKSESGIGAGNPPSEGSRDKDSSSDPSSSTYIHSYEVKLVIEFCDKGTLRQGRVIDLIQPSLIVVMLPSPFRSS
jgi:uncharacterized protein YjbI with pentapeptide repeats